MLLRIGRSISGDEEDTGENEGDAEQTGEREGVRGQIHQGEVIEDSGARKLAGDDGSDECGGAEFGSEGRAAEDDESAERSADPIPPWSSTQDGNGRKIGADDYHDQNGAEDGAADGEERGPANILQVGAQRGIRGSLDGNASAGDRGEKYPNKKHAGLERRDWRK